MQVAENHLRNARMILLNYYYYVVDWAGRQSYPHTPFMTDPAISLQGEAKANSVQMLSIAFRRLC